jgi:hypothetical protein
MKLLNLIGLLLLASNFGWAQNPKSQPNPPLADEKEETIKIDSTLVTIPISVIDPSGKYLLHLTPKDFRLYEEGTEQSITNFASIEVPVNVVLVVAQPGETSERL